MRIRPFVKIALAIGVSVMVSDGGPGGYRVALQAGSSSQAAPVPEANDGPISARSNAVVVEGAYAYFGSGKQLVIADVSSPGLVTELGRTASLNDSVHDVAVAGGLAYVAAGKAGLRVIDVSVPANPVEVGAHLSRGSTQAVALRGSTAFVADAWAGLRIIDVSSPTAPVTLAIVRTEHAQDVFVTKQHAFVADQEGGLRVIDVRVPARPEDLGWCSLPGDANGVQVVGRYAYVAAGGAGLQVVDVSTPKAPVKVGAYDALYARSLYVADNHAFVATERGGLWVIDVTNPAAPAPITSFAARGSANAVHVANGFAYVAVATTRASLWVFDVSNLGVPGLDD